MRRLGRIVLIGLVLLALFARAAHATFPTVDNTCTSLTSSASTSHSPCLPSGIAVNKLIVVIFSAQGSQTITWPAGWTALCTSTAQAGNLQGETRYRIADGSEGSSISVSTSGSTRTAHQAYLIGGWGGTSSDVACGTPSANNGTNPNPPALTPSWGAADDLWIVPLAARGGGTISADPASYTNGFGSSTGTGTTDAQTRSARRNLNATSDDPGTFTMTSESYVVSTIAVKPGTAGAAAGGFFRRRAQ
jgi:hypothetical protein